VPPEQAVMSATNNNGDMLGEVERQIEAMRNDGDA